MKGRNLVVKKSRLPGAGKGLFTKEAISKGSIVVEYKGKVSTWKKIEENEVFNGYVYYINRNHVVDAMHSKKALGRYANDARGMVKVPGLHNNAEYMHRQKKVFIRAIKDIAAGEEILVSYGKEYWDSIRYNIRLKASEKKKAAGK